MIVLDTNVLSAIMKPEFNAPAIEWLNRQDHELLRMTVVPLEELAYGLRMMPDGRRRAALTAGLAVLEAGPLGTRMLMLTADAAHQSAIARAAAVKATGHCDVPDALIAGIALAMAQASPPAMSTTSSSSASQSSIHGPDWPVMVCALASLALALQFLGYSGTAQGSDQAQFSSVPF